MVCNQITPSSPTPWSFLDMASPSVTSPLPHPHCGLSLRQLPPSFLPARPPCGGGKGVVEPAISPSYSPPPPCLRWSSLRSSLPELVPPPSSSPLASLQRWTRIREPTVSLPSHLGRPSSSPEASPLLASAADDTNGRMGKLGTEGPRWRAQLKIRGAGGLYRLFCWNCFSLRFLFGLFGSRPFQFFEFGKTPLQLVYSEICHYKFISSSSVPFSTSAYV
jgi:hypothetical protein